MSDKYFFGPPYAEFHRRGLCLTHSCLNLKWHKYSLNRKKLKGDKEDVKFAIILIWNSRFLLSPLLCHLLSAQRLSVIVKSDSKQNKCGWYTFIFPCTFRRRINCLDMFVLEQAFYGASTFVKCCCWDWCGGVLTESLEELRPEQVDSPRNVEKSL